jgi:hypothetical protein
MHFDNDHRLAIMLAGTVSLPSPFPAHGQVSLVTDTPRPGINPQVYVKIKQKLSDKQIITWFVLPDAIRAFRVPPKEGAKAALNDWEFRTAQDVEARIGEMRSRASQQSQANGPDEMPLFSAAIVHVPELAPVLVRGEVGVSAAEAAEGAAFLRMFGGCCH